MLSWIDPLLAMLTDQHKSALGFASHAASEMELQAAEEALGTRLPAAYRAFLARWNGSDAEHRGHRFLSIHEVVERALGEARFAPCTDSTTATNPDGFYAQKPMHWLFFYAHALGMDGYCLVLDGAVEPACRLYDSDWTTDESERDAFYKETFEALLVCAMYEELESVLDGELLEQVTQALQQVLDQHDWGALY